MADTCYVEFILAEIDLPVLEGLVGKTTRKIENRIATVKEKEAKGGWWDKLNILVCKRIPFIGLNYWADVDGGKFFCSAGGKYYFVETVEGEGILKCERGVLKPNSYRNLKNYEEGLAAAGRLIAQRADREREV